MKRRTVVMICMVSLLLLAFVGTSVDYAIIQDVISSGGAQNANSTDYAMDATLGQPAIGESASTDYGWCHGFWCGLVQAVTGPTTVAIGQAILAYQFTFDDLGMALGTITLVTLVAARWLYDNTLQLWGAT